ncbi:MAG: hypothetical protein HKN92_05775 [Chitinophagales bacterium]|nr:hypothetical protein [Chitinophagales bacterium]
MIKMFLRGIGELNLWQRVFGWKKIRIQGQRCQEQIVLIERVVRDLESENTDVKSVNKQLAFERDQLDKQVEIRNSKIEALEKYISDARKQIAGYENEKENRLKEHDNRIARLDQARISYETKEKSIHDDKLREVEEYHEAMKKKWSVHENEVEEVMRLLCNRHEVFYEDEVPFRGKPDNTVEICDEYVIFDAKCPKTDDLKNFPAYIKSEAEKAIKYTKLEGVRNEVFLVIPTNTVEHLPKLSFDMANYKVFVITKDALEPVIIALKKRENYEYLEQLSPEERENICRVIGKFFHSAKRKVQIDLYFIQDMLDVLSSSQNQLPDTMLDEAHRFEKAEKLNPPMEKRSKEIPLSKLEEDYQKVKRDADLRNVI